MGSTDSDPPGFWDEVAQSALVSPLRFLTLVNNGLQGKVSFKALQAGLARFFLEWPATQDQLHTSSHTSTQNQLHPTSSHAFILACLRILLAPPAPDHSTPPPPPTHPGTSLTPPPDHLTPPPTSGLQPPDHLTPPPTSGMQPADTTLTNTTAPDAPAGPSTASTPAEPFKWQPSMPFLLLDALPAYPGATSAPAENDNDDDNHHASSSSAPPPQPVAGPSYTTATAAQPEPEPSYMAEAPPQLGLDLSCVVEAVQLCRECFQQGHVKMGLRVAQAFNIRSQQVSQHAELVQLLGDCLQQQLAAGRRGLTAAVGLVMQFEVLSAQLSTGSLLASLVDAGQEGLAERWLASLGREERETYVECCVAADRLKAAGRVIKQYNMQDTFPEVEKVYRSRTFARLLERQLWPVAAQFVGHDLELQQQLVAAMIEHDQQQALDLSTQWNLPQSTMDLFSDGEARAQAEALRAAQYHGLAVPLTDVLLVDSMSSVHQAHAVLSQATLLGLDVEWRPSGPSKASLLQVATPDKVFLFDLLALAAPPSAPQQQEQGTTTGAGAEQGAQEGGGASQGGQSQGAATGGGSNTEYIAAVDACLCSVFQNQGCLKLGVEVGGDLRKLAGSWPQIKAFSAAGPILELRDLWAVHLEATNPNVSKLQRGAGLSTLCAALHGKPLDKSMQVSDWERWPLTARQTVYAAQDAHVLVTMYQRLVELVPNAGAVVSSKQYNFQATGLPSGGRRPSRRRPSSRPDLTLEAGGPMDLISQDPVGSESGTQSDDDSSDGDQGGPSNGGDGIGAANAGGVNGGAYPGDVNWEGKQGQAGAGSSSRACGAAGRALPVRGAGQAAVTAAAAAPGLAAVVAALAAAGLADCLMPLPAAAVDAGPGIATAMAAAHTLGIPLTQVAKSIALMVSMSSSMAACSAGAASSQHVEEGKAGHHVKDGSGPSTHVHQPWLVVLRGNQRLDMHKVSVYVGAPRKAIRIAALQECLEVFGSAPGCLAPFGLASPDIRVILDASLAHRDFQGGGADAPPHPLPPATSQATTPGPSMTMGTGALPQSMAPPVMSSCASALPLSSPLATSPALGIEADSRLPQSLQPSHTINSADADPQRHEPEPDAESQPVQLSSTVGAVRQASGPLWPSTATDGRKGGGRGQGPGDALMPPPFAGQPLLPAITPADQPFLRTGADASPTALDQPPLCSNTPADQPLLSTEAGKLDASHTAPADQPHLSPSFPEQPALPPAAPADQLSLSPNAPPDQPLLYTGAGGPDAVVRLTFTQLQGLSQGRVLDVATSSCSPGGCGSGQQGGGMGIGAAYAAGQGGTSNSSAAGTKKEVGFLLDSMLGRLCRWLRCLGVDAEHVGAPTPRAQVILKAATSGRVLLTRDANLALRRDAAAAAPYLLGSDDPAAQLREVSGRWGLAFNEHRAMSRCSHCNASDFQALDPSEAQPLVPEKVFQIVTEYWKCGSCGKIFWMGPKSYSAMSRVEGLLSGATKTMSTQ